MSVLWYLDLDPFLLYCSCVLAFHKAPDQYMGRGKTALQISNSRSKITALFLLSAGQ